MFEFIGGFRPAKHTLFPPATQTPLDQACLISLCNTVPGQPHMLIAGADGTITPVTFPGRISGATGFVIGVSAPRAKSRLGPDRRKGRLLPDPATASQFSRCGLYVCDRASGLHSFIDLTAYGSEIYQVALLPAQFNTGSAA